jgi:hypothetical protein
MQLPELKDFWLVGGTALSLKFGHRVSVDLDLFSTKKPDIKSLSSKLERIFKRDFITEKLNIEFAIFCRINSIKVDILYYPHAIIESTRILKLISK